MTLEYNLKLIDKTKEELEKNLKNLKNSIYETNRIIKKLEEYFSDKKINDYEELLSTYNKKYYFILDSIKQIEDYQNFLEKKKTDLEKISKNTINRFE